MVPNPLHVKEIGRWASIGEVALAGQHSDQGEQASKQSTKNYGGGRSVRCSYGVCTVPIMYDAMRGFVYGVCTLHRTTYDATYGD